MKNNTMVVQVIALLSILIVSSVIVYKPGLSGDFLLDDAKQLTKLNCIHGQYNINGLKCFFVTDSAGILKRPLSVVTFLIDADDWPTAPYSFLRTNLIIHMINGLLLFFFLMKLFDQSVHNRKLKIIIAFTVTGSWMLNPFLVSTVLYPIQRMAMIPVTFTLLGMYLYLSGRVKYQYSKAGVKTLFIAVYLFPVFAFLAKENGILLIFFIVLLESQICINFLKFKPLSNRLRFWLITVPAIALTIAILIIFTIYLKEYELRDYTLYERLITEFRVLTNYIHHLLIPNYFTEGIFTDGINISTGITQPVETLFSMIFILALLTVAFTYRKKFPLISFSIFFFFIAHLLESTFIPLELSFEHRNYLPSLFLFMPFTYLLVKFLGKSTIYFAILIAMLFYLSFITYLRSSYWGNSIVMLESSMNKFPLSKRARKITASIYKSRGMDSVTADILKEGIAKFDTFDFKLSYITLQCSKGKVIVSDLDNFIKEMRYSYIFRNDMISFNELIDHLLNEKCIADNADKYIQKLIKTFENNQHKFGEHMAFMTLTLIKSKVSLKAKNYKKAMNYYKQLYESSGNFKYIINAIKLFIEKQQFDFAHEMLLYIKINYQDEKWWKIDWFNVANEIKLLESQIEGQK